jgi:hypothetical protein
LGKGKKNNIRYVEKSDKCESKGLRNEANPQLEIYTPNFNKAFCLVKKAFSMRPLYSR